MTPEQKLWLEVRADELKDEVPGSIEEDAIRAALSELDETKARVEEAEAFLRLAAEHPEASGVAYGPWLTKLRAFLSTPTQEVEPRFTLVELDIAIARVWEDAAHRTGLNPFLRSLRAALTKGRGT